MKLKPSLAETHNNLGFALRLRGRLDEAIDEFQKALKLRMDYPDAQNNLDSALHAKHDSASSDHSH